MNLVPLRALISVALLSAAGALGTGARAETAGVTEAPAATVPPVAVAADPAPPTAAAGEQAPPTAAATESPAATSATPPAASEPATSAAPPAATQVGKNTLTAPPEGMGQVVFYRPSRLGGMALSFSVHEGQTGVGKLGNGSYFVLTPTPGPHTYTIESEVTDSLTLEVDPGETYYVQQTIGMGIMMGRPHLAPSDASAFGAKALKVSTRKPTDKNTVARNDAKPAEAGAAK